MQTSIENFPIEIWFSIFQYLEVHHLFKSFSNLNNYLNKILSSKYLLFYLQLKELDNNHFQYPINPSWSNDILNRVKYLKSSNEDSSDYFHHFLAYHSNKLIQLKSLFIKIYPRNLSFFYVALKNLHELEYISIKCIPNENLLKSILSLPNLRICHLLLRERITDIDCQLKLQSNIQHLILVFYYNINNSIINLFLTHTPKLRRLEICGSYAKSDQVAIFDRKCFVLEELRIIKFKLENGLFTFDCFKYLNEIMPRLKYFYFDYYNHYLHEHFLTYLIEYWWIIIQHIKQLDININGHINIDVFDDIQQKNLEKHQEILLAKNKELDGHMKVNWIEQNLTKSKHIQINIHKS